MPARKKIKKGNLHGRVINAFGDKIIDEVRDYSNVPSVIRKGNQAQAFLEKHGFPKELQK